MYLNFPGGRNPYYGGYIWPAMPIFDAGRAVPIKNHVWKFGSDWLSLSRESEVFEFSVREKPLIRGGGGYMWPAMLIFELVQAIPVKSHVWKFGLDWLSLSRVIISTNIQKNKSYCVRKQTYKHTNIQKKKKKKFTDATENKILGKILFRRIIKINTD